MDSSTREGEDYTLLRLILVPVGLWITLGLGYRNTCNKLPTELVDAVPGGREFRLGLSLDSFGSFLDLIFQVGLCFYSWLASPKFRKLSISKLVGILTVDAIFFGIILSGVYLESRFLPWTLGSCKHYDAWHTTVDGRNLFVEMDKRSAHKPIPGQLCKDLVLRHGGAIALLCFHVLCAVTQIVEAVTLLRAAIDMPVPLFLLYLPILLFVKVKGWVRYVVLRKTTADNRRFNNKRFRDVTLPNNVVANITRLGELHYIDLYNVRLSSKKLSHVFFGDDVGESLRALRGVPCSKDERLECRDCKLPACHLCLSAGWSAFQGGKHISCLPYCKRHRRTQVYNSNQIHRQCRIHMAYSERGSLPPPCKLCKEERLRTNRSSDKRMSNDSWEVSSRRRRLGWKGKILCATCKEDLPNPSSRYWGCPCGVPCELGKRHDLRR